jgi:DNA helicase II / ATP-dependent DNA helicase PcrA
VPSKRLDHSDLTSEQETVLETNGDLLVVGRPGTGKTSIALLKAIEHLSESDDHDACVLFLSFSRAAVQRIEAAAKLYVPRLVSKRLVITTFHAFCFDVLNSHARLVGMPGLRRIVLPHEERMVAADAARTALASLPALADSEAEVDVNDVVDDALDVLSGQKAIDETPGGRSRSALEGTLARVGTERVRLERQEGRVPFERLLELALDLFRRHAALRSAYASAFPLILVDEYQDTSDKQDELIDLLAAPGQVVYLGDPEQQIYDWLKGVRADRFERLIVRRKPARVDLPERCHRSGTSDLIIYGRAVLSGIALATKPKDVTPLRYAVGKFPHQVRVAITMAEKGARAKAKLPANGHPEVAIMSYKNGFVARLSSELRGTTESFKHPFPHRLHVGLEEVAPAWALALSFLEHAKGLTDGKAVGEALSQLARYERAQGGKGRLKRAETLLEVATAMQSGGKVAARSLRDLSARIASMSALFSGEPRQDIGRVIELFRATPGDYFKDAVETLDLRSPADAGESLVGQLAGSFASHGRYLGAQKIGEDFLVREHLVRGEAGCGGRIVMTLHKCKGKEFDAVVIVDGPSEADGIVLRDDDDRLSRSRRLLAMAIARARYNVVIVTPAYRPCPLLPRIP